MPISYVVSENFSDSDNEFIEQLDSEYSEKFELGFPSRFNNGGRFYSGWGPQGMLVEHADPLFAPQLLPQYQVPSPSTITFVPGRLLLAVTPPLDWGKVRPGATTCWTGASPAQQTDLTLGKLVIGACAGSKTETDVAEGLIGSVVNVPAGASADAYVTWFMTSEYRWSFRPGGGESTTIATSVHFEVWEWRQGQPAKLSDWAGVHRDQRIFSAKGWKLADTLSVPHPPTGRHGSAVAKIALPANGGGKYFVGLNLWTQITNHLAPGAVGGDFGQAAVTHRLNLVENF
ncbi:MAG: hypothetical protein JJ902_21795 [Roseibium sp.]|nr:hypothetical protein [Roseibium sp.]